MRINRNIHNYFTILILFGVIGCSGNAVKTAKNDCASISDDHEKYRCYLQDLRYNVRSQIMSDLTTWFELNYPNGNRLLNDTTVGIKLKSNGEISELNIIQSSGDGSFDNALLQAIRNAAPFELPKEEKIRARLQEFSWQIVF